MEDLAHFNFVKTNHNRHLTQVKERKRRDKMIYEITNSEEIYSFKEDIKKC